MKKLKGSKICKLSSSPTGCLMKNKRKKTDVHTKETSKHHSITQRKEAKNQLPIERGAEHRHDIMLSVLICTRLISNPFLLHPVESAKVLDDIERENSKIGTFSVQNRTAVWLNRLCSFRSIRMMSILIRFFILICIVWFKNFRFLFAANLSL